jgi:hypothetical protein
MKTLLIFLIVVVAFAAFAESTYCYRCEETPPNNSYPDCDECDDSSYNVQTVYRGGLVKCCYKVRDSPPKKSEGGYDDGDQDATSSG